MSIQARFKVDRGDFKLDVDLSIPENGVSALFGPSGCGKTTMLRAIAGLDHYSDGYLKAGNEIWQEKGLFIPPHKRSIGYIFQESSLFPHLNVKQNLEYGVKRVPETQQKVALSDAVELLEISHLLTQKPAHLSGGERQRVAIARAVAVSPKLLLMDEPLASLDQKRKREILPYISSLHSELDIPIIYVSHSAEEVAQLADHLVLLEAGKITASGAINDLLTRLDLPFVHESDAAAVIEVTVASHDTDYHLTYLDSEVGRFTVTYNKLQPGSKAKLRIAARDISLTLEAQTNTSILNIFPATVTEVIPEGEAQVTVRLLAAGVPILARITRKSASLLNLTPGSHVYAQAKSVAMLA